MRLADFILKNMEPILQGWEDFARTITPASRVMDAASLRDHAGPMLRTIAADLQGSQTTEGRIAKSPGDAAHAEGNTAAETHAAIRWSSGFTIDQMVSEYRALRASVLKLWLQQIDKGAKFEVRDIMRFNESIDQALAESVAKYTMAVEESRNVFLGILSHDLRSPLGAILLSADMLLRTEDLGAKPTKSASRIYASVKRASKIVDDLLDFTRSQLGPGIPVQCSEVDLTQACDGIVEEARTYYPDAVFAYEPGGAIVGQFDRTRIEQVFANLINNAAQHGKTDRIITIRLGLDSDKVVFEVKNLGEPIPAEAIPEIFNSMRRFSSGAADEAGPKSGLGLGLYIAKEIVVAHGGVITVTSNATEGTVFTVTLPFSQIEPAQAERQ